MGWSRQGSGGRGVRPNWLTLSAALFAGLIAASHPAGAQGTASCAKAEFENAVDEAAASLRDLNNKNRPDFQERLRKLKDKRGWDNDQFLKEAAPFVKDDAIEVFDNKTNDLLAEISSMGQEGATAKVPDCEVLTKLRTQMALLVDTQVSKWTYMFKKLDDELAK
jgi:hypothetical protein